MKKIILICVIALTTFSAKAQSCDEIMEYVKKEGVHERTYTSYNSDAISKVTFYKTTVALLTNLFWNTVEEQLEDSVFTI